ncbi:hypothetical protein LEP1GSC050_1781 [Leptospira broomii serovar Hurstbridge str. 5399]|uniref:Uncharacterized protein n=1 Tax=Leptospira broomii serovar Hurstbridge str. 5399 TaxID=1049789 RepID=T0G8Y2_9LEPT|nr:hypothetical protein [Leptospira broomii]EQA43284.1 hypothetical protein LEP1GSC050_1781 [Leptospira broomii serovar Hurstbridge str. 5399]
MSPNDKEESKKEHFVLKGDAADAFFRRIVERNTKASAERLADAKKEAERRGKEPFDLEKLERLYDTRKDTEGRVDPFEVRHTHYEDLYYTYDRNIMTLEEFVIFLERTNHW